MKFVATQQDERWLLRTATCAVILAVLLLPVGVYLDSLNGTESSAAVSKREARFVPLAKVKKSFKETATWPIATALVRCPVDDGALTLNSCHVSTDEGQNLSIWHILETGLIRSPPCR